MMMKLLRFNQYYKYNFEMNDVDVADQLHLFFRFDVWIENIKCWCYLFLWSLQVLTTNAWI